MSLDPYPAIAAGVPMTGNPDRGWPRPFDVLAGDPDIVAAVPMPTTRPPFDNLIWSRGRRNDLVAWRRRRSRGDYLGDRPAFLDDAARQGRGEKQGAGKEADATETRVHGRPRKVAHIQIIVCPPARQHPARKRRFSNALPARFVSPQARPYASLRPSVAMSSRHSRGAKPLSGWSTVSPASRRRMTASPLAEICAAPS
jgi:hypothetical protein